MHEPNDSSLEVLCCSTDCRKLHRGMENCYTAAACLTKMYALNSCKLPITSFHWLILFNSPPTDCCRASSWIIVVSVPWSPFRMADAIPEYGMPWFAACNPPCDDSGTLPSGILHCVMSPGGTNACAHSRCRVIIPEWCAALSQ